MSIWFFSIYNFGYNLEFLNNIYHQHSDAERMYLSAHKALVARLKDPQLTFMVETSQRNVEEVPDPVLIRGGEWDSLAELSDLNLSDAKMHPCSYFFPDKKHMSSVSAEVSRLCVLLHILTSSGIGITHTRILISRTIPNKYRLFVYQSHTHILIPLSNSICVFNCFINCE